MFAFCSLSTVNVTMHPVKDKHKAPFASSTALSACSDFMKPSAPETRVDLLVSTSKAQEKGAEYVAYGM